MLWVPEPLFVPPLFLRFGGFNCSGSCENSLCALVLVFLFHCIVLELLAHCVHGVSRKWQVLWVQVKTREANFFGECV